MGKITDKDVFAATSNGDGTHNGVKLAQWLYEATTGKPMSDEDAKDLVAKAVAEGKRRREAKLEGR
jgi:hypothetical protein